MLFSCRYCKDLKNNEKTKVTSIGEEIKPEIINKSIYVSLTERYCIADLPLLWNSIIKLKPHKVNAIKVYE